MTTQNIEDLSAQISAKTGARILWGFGGVLLLVCALYYGMLMKIDSNEARHQAREEKVDGKFDVINTRLDDIKKSVSDAKDDIKDVRNAQFKQATK